MLYDNLRNAIVKQAVDDYINAARSIKRLKDNEQKTIIQIITNGLKLKKPKFLTYEQAVGEFNAKVYKQKCMMISIESFFRSSWYKQMCTIDGEYMITKTKEKALRMFGIDCDNL